MDLNIRKFPHQIAKTDFGYALRNDGIIAKEMLKLNGLEQSKWL